ncbi:hypothetical protein [Candidatus Harpocratesius sp.]
MKYLSQNNIQCPFCGALAGSMDTTNQTFPSLKILRFDIHGEKIEVIFFCRLCGHIVKTDDELKLFSED